MVNHHLQIKNLKNIMSVNKAYRLLTNVPIGTEMIINKTSKSVKLVEIRYFPTRYKCDDGNYYYTHDVKILWP